MMFCSLGSAELSLSCYRSTFSRTCFLESGLGADLNKQRDVLLYCSRHELKWQVKLPGFLPPRLAELNMFRHGGYGGAKWGRRTSAVASGRRTPRPRQQAFELCVAGTPDVLLAAGRKPTSDGASATRQPQPQFSDSSRPAYRAPRPLARRTWMPAIHILGGDYVLSDIQARR